MMDDAQMEHQRALHLGVDGGGSQTTAVVVDERGNERGRGQAGSSNYQAVGLESALAHLRQAATAAASAADRELPVASAWFGLAGLDSAADVAVLLPQVQLFASRVRLTNDAELVLSGLEEYAGVALIAGTGAIALGRDASGRTARASGWGHVLGDEGSGYDLGRQGLRAAVRAADGRGQPTKLLRAILDIWGLAAPEQILQRVYPALDKAEIARLAPLVLRCAEDGDAAASAIVRGGSLELAIAAWAVNRALGFSGVGEPMMAPLALGGGLLTGNEFYRRAVLGELERRGQVGRLVVVDDPALSAARAAARMAVREHSDVKQG